MMIRKFAKHGLFLLSFLLISLSVNAQEENSLGPSTIDKTLQDSVISILERRLLQYGATSGRVMIMHAPTGYILSDVSIEKVDTFKYKEVEPIYTPRPTGLFNAVTLLTILKTGKVHLSDKFDAEHGYYMHDGLRIMDHNWHRGGYGELSLQEGVEKNSKIVMVKALDKAFPDTMQYYNAVEKIGFPPGKEFSGYVQFATGYRETTPLEMLSFFSSIANKGKVICPVYEKVKPEHPTVEIASKKEAKTMDKVLSGVVTQGLGSPAQVDFTKVRGYPYSLEDEEHNFHIDFCGYLDIKGSRYTILVMMQKEGLPASGGTMAGSIFKEIAIELNKELSNK